MRLLYGPYQLASPRAEGVLEPPELPPGYTTAGAAEGRSVWGGQSGTHKFYNECHIVQFGIQSL